MNALPEILQLIAEEMGEETALRFATSFGGRRVHLSDKIDHPIAQAVGKKCLDILLDHYGGGYIIVPLGPLANNHKRRASIVKMLEEGLSYDTIARNLGCHRRTVEKIASKLRHTDKRQLNLEWSR